MHIFYYPYQFSTRIRHSQVSRQATFYRDPALRRLNTQHVYMYTVFFTNSNCTQHYYCQSSVVVPFSKAQHMSKCGIRHRFWWEIVYYYIFSSLLYILLFNAKIKELHWLIVLFTGKNNGFPFLDIVGYLKEYP